MPPAVDSLQGGNVVFESSEADDTSISTLSGDDQPDSCSPFVALWNSSVKVWVGVLTATTCT